MDNEKRVPTLEEVERAVLDDEDPEEYENDSMGWSIADDRAAEWCIQHIRSAEEELKKWEDFYNAQVEICRKRYETTRAQFEGFLLKYLKEQSAKGLTKKTATSEKYVLPSATLMIKKGTWKYDRTDDILTDWLKRNGYMDMVKTKVVQSADWASLKKRTTTDTDGTVILTETGEVINGVRATMQPDAFKVE